MAEETTPENPFDAVRDQIQFEGFTDAQEEAILDQLEEAYNAEGGTTGRDMIDKGLALPDGFTIHNSNNQAVTEQLGQDILSDILANNPGLNPSQADIDQFLTSQFDQNLSGNFAFSGSGDVYINAYPSLDAAGQVETYNFTGAARDGQTADAQPPITSLDHDGTVFEVPSNFTLLHEANHAINDEPDIEGNNLVAGEYYSPGMIGNTPVTIPNAYYGANEVTTQQILEEMGYDQFRGSYIGTALNGRAVGDEYGLGEEFDVAITPIYTQEHVDAGATSVDIDMTGHGAVDAVVVSPDGYPSTIETGDGRQIVHAFDQADTITMGSGNDRGFAGLGNDTFNAGWGTDVYDGGDANLDPASDHRSDMATDWGFDTVDYTTLPTGFASPDALQVDTSFDGVARDGVLITLDGEDISVNKGQENSVRVGEDVDALHNIDAVTGTNRDDLAEITSLSGDRVLDGAGGTDTLRIDTISDSSTVTHNPGPVTFNGVTYDGVVTDGTNNTYYTGFENVVPIAAEQTAVDTHMDANSIAPIIPPVDASLDGAPTQTLTMEDAVRILHEEGAEAVAQERAAGIEDGPVSHMINSPAGVSVMEELVANGEESVEVDSVALEGDAYSRVNSVLRGSMERIEELDKVEEVEERNAEHLEQAVEPDTVVHQMPLAEQIQSVENDMDYDYAL